MTTRADPILTVAQMRAAEEALIAAGETVDVLGAIETAARVRRIGTRGDAAATDAGVECLRLDREFAQGLFSREPH